MEVKRFNSNEWRQDPKTMDDQEYINIEGKGVFRQEPEIILNRQYPVRLIFVVMSTFFHWLFSSSLFSRTYLIFSLAWLYYEKRSYKKAALLNLNLIFMNILLVIYNILYLISFLFFYQNDNWYRDDVHTCKLRKSHQLLMMWTMNELGLPIKYSITTVCLLHCIPTKIVWYGLVTLTYMIDLKVNAVRK